MIDFLVNNSGIVGLVAFFVFFTVTAIRLYRPGVKKTYDYFANIPFMEDSRDK